MFMVSIVGLMTVFVRAIDRPMSNDEVLVWERERIEGRRNYIRRAFLLWSPPTLTFVGFVGYLHFSTNGISAATIIPYVAVVLLVIGSIVLSADRFWRRYQVDYQTLVNKRTML